MRKFYSVDDVFGGKSYYNEDGDKVAWSADGIFGGEDFYNADGEHIGYSVDGIFGGKTIYLDEEEDMDDGFDRRWAAEQRKEAEREARIQAFRKKSFDDPWDRIINS